MHNFADSKCIDSINNQITTFNKICTVLDEKSGSRCKLPVALSPTIDRITNAINFKRTVGLKYEIELLILGIESNARGTIVNCDHKSVHVNKIRSNVLIDSSIVELLSELLQRSIR